MESVEAVGDDNDPLGKAAAGNNSTNMGKTGKDPGASNHNLREGKGVNFCTKRRENVEIDVGREWVGFREALLDDRQVTSPPRPSSSTSRWPWLTLSGAVPVLRRKGRRKIY